jgi:hypothetical protein
MAIRLCSTLHIFDGILRTATLSKQSFKVQHERPHTISNICAVSMSFGDSSPQPRGSATAISIIWTPIFSLEEMLSMLYP